MINNDQSKGERGDFKAKCTKFDFRWLWLRPELRWGSLLRCVMKLMTCCWPVSCISSPSMTSFLLQVALLSLHTSSNSLRVITSRRTMQGSLQRCSSPLAIFKGLISKGKEGEGKGTRVTHVFNPTLISDHIHCTKTCYSNNSAHFVFSSARRYCDQTCLLVRSFVHYARRVFLRKVQVHLSWNLTRMFSICSKCHY